LAAIESNDRKVFPSAFFYRSFVQQYAQALSLDLKKIDTQLDALLSAEAPLPLPGQDGNPIRKREVDVTYRPSVWNRLRWVFAVVLVAGLGSGGYYAWRSLKLKIVSIATVAPAASLIRQPTPPPIPAPVAAPDLPATTAQPAVSAPVPAPRRRVAITVVAKEQTWLSIYSDGKPDFAGILEANQTKSIESTQLARLTIGNAAGVEIQFNGKTVQPLGAHGQIIRIVFTPGQFRIVPAAEDGA